MTCALGYLERSNRESWGALPHRRRRCRPRVDELLRDGFDTEVEAFESARAQQGEVARLAEDDVVPHPLARHGDHDDAGPALKYRPVRLAEPPLIVALDA